MQPLLLDDPLSVGPYRLVARLGAGGMGQVFLAADGRRQLVAVKLVHPGLAHDGEFRSRFRREVAAGRQLDGPFVAAVLDADPDAATPWLATEYVPGPSLDDAVTPSGRLASGLSASSRTAWPPRWPRSTPQAWSTATSSRPTCCSVPIARG